MFWIRKWRPHERVALRGWRYSYLPKVLYCCMYEVDEMVFQEYGPSHFSQQQKRRIDMDQPRSKVCLLPTTSSHNALFSLRLGPIALSPTSRRAFCSSPSGNEKRFTTDAFSPTTPTATALDALTGMDHRLAASVKRGGDKLLNHMTPIQALAWDVAVLQNKDMIGIAPTGTGKTLAFCLPVVQRILINKDKGKSGIQAIILAPTRELVIQIGNQMEWILKGVVVQKQDAEEEITTMKEPRLSSCTVHGGRPEQREMTQIFERHPSVLIGTPSRILHHLESLFYTKILESNDSTAELKLYFTTPLDVMVLDEFDRLLERDHVKVVEKLSTWLKPVQTLAFSATQSESSNEAFSSIFKSCPILVNCAGASTQNQDEHTSAAISSIDQSYVILPENQLLWGTVQVLMHLMKEDHKIMERKKILVFFSTKAQVVFYARLFNHVLGQRVLALTSDVHPNQREIISHRFRNATTIDNLPVVLFASDVLARGMDYPHVTHVVQVGLAQSPILYTHRLGRAGRLGSKTAGQGIVILAGWEAERQLQSDSQPLNGLEPNSALQSLLGGGLDPHLEDMRMRVVAEMRKKKEDRTSTFQHLLYDARAMYLSLLGFHMSLLGQRKSLNEKEMQNERKQVVDWIHDFLIQFGLKHLPTLTAQEVGQYQLEFLVSSGVVHNVRRPVWKWGHSFDVGNAIANDSCSDHQRSSADRRPER